MSQLFAAPRVRWLGRTERLIAIAAVGVTAASLMHPKVLASTGLSFDRPVAVAIGGHDFRPTGSLAGPAGDPARIVHGLAGTLHALRGRD